jgi:hypothetical protein
MVTVHVEVDASRNVVRASASGATELQAKTRETRKLTADELLAAAAQSMGVNAVDVTLTVGIDGWQVFMGIVESKGLFGLMKQRRPATRVVDAEGTVRLSAENLTARKTTVGELGQALGATVSEATTYGDAGGVLPSTVIACGREWIDLGGVSTFDQMQTLATTSLAGRVAEEEVLILCVKR